MLEQSIPTIRSTVVRDYRTQQKCSKLLFIINIYLIGNESSRVFGTRINTKNVC